jgi:hypothetical protein
MRRRLAGEWRAIPVGMPSLEGEASDLRHEVELCRPHVSVRRAEQRRLGALAEAEVV